MWYNPFYIFAIAFGVVLLIYQLGWSALYPSLSVGLGSFLVVSIVISIFLGRVLQKSGKLQYREVKYHKAVILITAFIVVSYLFEFAFCGYVPLLQILLGQRSSYNLFGVPVFHVFLVTFSSFYAVYLFHMFLGTKRWLCLFLYCIIIFSGLLIYNRAMITFIVASSMFVYLFSKGKNRWKVVLNVTLVMLIILYGFGLLGNMRTNVVNGSSMFSTKIIMQLSDAEESFQKSFVPKPFYWSYLYFSSPLANVQTTINKAQYGNDSDAYVSYFVYCCMPDFISKRIGAYFNITKPRPILIADNLTAAASYSTSFAALGWLGTIFTFVYYMFCCFLYVKILSSNDKYFVSGVAILCTVMFFAIFTNTLVFSGLSLQLWYPLFSSLRRSFHSNPNKDSRRDMLCQSN